jgi:hypothetical protein
VTANVELAYATTVHRAQGMTVDAAHVLVDKTMTRESLYVARSRGPASNRAYVVTDEALDVDLHVPPGPPLDALDVLRGVLARESTERSATETIGGTLETAESLATFVPTYLDAFARAVITEDLEASVRAGLRDAGGLDLEVRVSASPAWRQLLLACAGDEPRPWPRPSGPVCSTVPTRRRTRLPYWPGESRGLWTTMSRGPMGPVTPSALPGFLLHSVP